MTAGPPPGVRLLKAAALLLLALYLMHIMTAGHDEIVAGPPAQGVDSDELSSDFTRGLDVLDGHREDCWQGGDAPLASLPSAAIVRFTASGEVVYTRKHDLVDRAFSEVLGDPDPRLDVVALCR